MLLSRLCCVFIFWLLSSLGLVAQAEPVVIVERTEPVSEEADVYYPSADAPLEDEKDISAIVPEVSLVSQLSQVFIFLLVLGAVAVWLVHSSRKGRLPKRGPLPGQPQLNVVETKMLGNKQFLVVVEYGEQKMLLGVGPGTINQLCYLASPFEPGAEGSPQTVATTERNPGGSVVFEEIQEKDV